jgi:RimJ/RimL family protein N-acetyltransferase
LEYYPWEGRTEQDVREFIQKFIDWQGEDPRSKYQLAITFPEQERTIGNCGIRMDSQDAKSANIGYEIAPDYWGRGFATESAQAMLTFGFEELKLHRIWAHCVLENIASRHVLENIGMRREGHLRETEFIKGLWRDSYIYAILDHEWIPNKSAAEELNL